MKNWKEIEITGIARIERVAARFHIFAENIFPSAFVKVKILEGSTGRYRGMANMAIRDIETGEPIWIEGQGETVVEALEQTISVLLKTISGRHLSLADVVWKDFRKF